MEFTRAILSKIDTELEGLRYDANDRNNLSAALFDIAIDHAKSIIVLTENSIYSSAYALVDKGSDQANNLIIHEKSLKGKP